MGLLKNLFGKKDQPINSNEDFWNWFTENETAFFRVIKNKGNVERDFFDKLSPKLDQLGEGFWFLAGMFDDEMAELVLTADGDLTTIVFVEELVNAAPKINNWKFTALKPALDIENVNIRMNDFEFNKDKLTFYPNENPKHPDEIDITVLHSDYQEDIKEPIISGTYIFLDNFLGELNSVTSIDNLQIIGKSQAENDLIPIEKLKDYLIWRQKEFIEKYEGTRYNTDNDHFNSLEATLPNGKPLLAIVNSVLLEWDRKASHPWILNIEIKYKGNESGLPDKETYELMNIFEDSLVLELKDSDGYLNVGRQTADGTREIYFACKDFRLPAKILRKYKADYKGRLELEYDIYKDKYWISLDRYRPSL